MNSANDLVEMMNIAMSKIKEMVDVNTVVGQPIFTPDGNTIIPVSKSTFGFGVGGSEFGSAAKNVGGATGAGVSVSPVGFLIINPEGVKLLPVCPPASSSVDRVIELAPSMVDKIAAFFKKKKDAAENC